MSKNPDHDILKLEKKITTNILLKTVLKGF